MTSVEQKTEVKKKIVNWVNTCDKVSITFGELEDKVYEETTGMSYSDTMSVFHNILDWIGVTKDFAFYRDNIISL